MQWMNHLYESKQRRVNIGPLEVESKWEKCVNTQNSSHVHSVYMLMSKNRIGLEVLFPLMLAYTQRYIEYTQQFGKQGMEWRNVGEMYLQWASSELERYTIYSQSGLCFSNCLFRSLSLFLANCCSFVSSSTYTAVLVYVYESTVYSKAYTRSERMS